MPPKFSYEDTSAYLYIHPAMTLRRPPCQAVCPAGIPISLMNKLLAEGKKEEALSILLDITPFPDVMCECCAKPCESACNKKRFTSVPVPVSRLVQLAASCLPDANPPCGEKSGYHVAVVGLDSFALTTAYFFHRLGHAVTVAGASTEENVEGGFRKRLEQYLSRQGVLFCDTISDISSIEDGFDVILTGKDVDTANSTKSLAVLQKIGKGVAWVQQARTLACEVDANLHGYQLKDIAWVCIFPNGEVARELLPKNFPSDAKPVTTVRYEDLNNKAFHSDKLTFRDRLSPLESLEEQAMECFHCGKCIGCGTCVNVCPGDVLAMENGKPYVRYPDECIHCSACMLDCPSGAIFFRLPLPATLGASMKYLA